MIFDYIYGNLHRICVYNLDYSSIEKHAKNALCELWPILRIHYQALLYLITSKSNVNIALGIIDRILMYKIPMCFTREEFLHDTKISSKSV